MFSQVFMFGSDLSSWVWFSIIVVADKRIGGQSGGETHWTSKATLVDSRTSVNDVKFAPRHLGLMLVYD